MNLALVFCLCVQEFSPKKIQLSSLLLAQDACIEGEDPPDGVHVEAIRGILTKGTLSNV